MKVRRKIENLHHVNENSTQNLKGPSFDGSLVREEAEEAETWKQTQF